METEGNDMANDKTGIAFHEAKSSLESELGDWTEIAEADERNIAEELIESIHNTFGKEFLEELKEEL